MGVPERTNLSLHPGLYSNLFVLSGWEALLYGQTGKGPAAPSLTPLLQDVSMEDLETIIDTLFFFSDQTLPRLRIDGDLRPLMHATLATMIMYYEDRAKEDEMGSVLRYMRTAFNKIGVPGQDAHVELCKWGKQIHTKFDVDNLRLTAKKEHGGHEQVH